jgi:hypothetical protein
LGKKPAIFTPQFLGILGMTGQYIPKLSWNSKISKTTCPKKHLALKSFFFIFLKAVLVTDLILKF